MTETESEADDGNGKVAVAWAVGGQITTFAGCLLLVTSIGLVGTVEGFATAGIGGLMGFAGIWMITDGYDRVFGGDQ